MQPPFVAATVSISAAGTPSLYPSASPQTRIRGDAAVMFDGAPIECAAACTSEPVRTPPTSMAKQATRTGRPVTSFLRLAQSSPRDEAVRDNVA
jgi:hypothetical protein